MKTETSNLTRAHRARLLQIWRSAGWPHRDLIDLDLLAARLVAACGLDSGNECLRITQAGLDWLSEARHRMRRAESLHDKLADLVARKLMDAGRLVWRELSLRARVEHADGTGEWRMARPDLFSVRHTTVREYLHPVVHEIKASRADLLSDLRKPAKRGAYGWLCAECYYVFPADVAECEEIPPELGIWTLHGSVEDGRLEFRRPARHTACELPFAVWMALAKATPQHGEPGEEAQGWLTIDATDPILPVR